VKTIVKHWYIIKVLDPKDESLLGQLLWGIVVNDERNRFNYGDYVSSSVIKEINLELKLVVTNSNSEYVIQGEGNEFSVYFSEVKLLDKGFSPEQILQVRQSEVNNKKKH